jgi:large subunit ribosomal protein LP0
MKSAIMEIIDKDLDEKKPERPHLRLIYNQLKLNTGMIFTNGDLGEIKKILDSQVREAPAKIGILAPADVTIPAGPTGMDPKQTSFFQNLNIATKIVKGQVEIVNAVKIITFDEKITPGQAALLDKLKIRPFEYKMHIKIVLDNGRLYPAAVLSITNDTILAAFGRSVENVAAVSLASGYSTQASIHHTVLNAFKHLACASFASGFSFKEADKLKAAAGARPAASSAPVAAAKVEAKVEEKEEEVDIDMGDLFGY